jgi:hypothetical protein
MMLKKIIVAIVMSGLALTSQLSHADPFHGGYHGGYYGGYHGGYHGYGYGSWVGPAIVGGMIGYGLASSYYAYPAPYYYPYPVATYAPVVVSQPATVYVESAPTVAVVPAAPQPQQNSWYHCDKPEGYYPYIKECQTGWKTVPAVPPAPPVR